MAELEVEIDDCLGSVRLLVGASCPQRDDRRSILRWMALGNGCWSLVQWLMVFLHADAVLVLLLCCIFD